jgi:ribose transport system substrate-binding protein
MRLRRPTETAAIQSTGLNKMMTILPAFHYLAFTCRARLVLAALLLFVLFLSACSSLAAPTPSSPDISAREVVIGLSLPDDSDPYYLAVKKEAESLVLRRGGRVLTSSAGSDPDRQERDIQALLSSQVQALLIFPIDSERIVSSITAAKRSGVPVITLDREASGGSVLAHIGSDNSGGGWLAARYLAVELKGRGIVVELQGSAGSTTALARSEGFGQGLHPYPGMQLAVAEPANFSRETARQVFARILSEQPEIDAVFAHSDEMLLGAQQAALAAGRAGEILFIGFDGIPDVVAGIENGLFAATIAQQPGEMGRLGAELALKAVQGETVPSTLIVELALLSR